MACNNLLHVGNGLVLLLRTAVAFVVSSNSVVLKIHVLYVLVIIAEIKMLISVLFCILFLF